MTSVRERDQTDWVRLVFGMTPPSGTEYVASPAGARERFVLLMLAYLADRNGVTEVRLTDLNAATLYPVKLIRESIRTWEDLGAVIRTPGSSGGPNTYRLVRPVLESRQLAEVHAARRSVMVLDQIGLDTRGFNALNRAGVHTVDDLAAKVEEFRELPDKDRARGFHTFCGVAGMGVRTGLKILQVYDLWQATITDSPVADCTHDMNGM